MVSVADVFRGALQMGERRLLGRRGLQRPRARVGCGAAMSSIRVRRAGLHRLEAGTLLHNLASQRVLEKNGFERFGLARKLLRINGEWRDHVLFERLAD